MTLRQQLVALIALLNVGATVTCVALDYYFRKAEFLETIDRRLLEAAQGAQFIFGDEYQRRVQDRTSIPPDEDYRNVVKLSDYANKMGLTYVGAMIQVDGRFYYTVTSSPPHEIANGSYDKFFTEYQEASPALKQSFQDGQVRFEDHQDSYGRFRSAYVPYRLHGGAVPTYVYVADLALDAIWAQLHAALLRTVLEGFGICAVMLALTCLLARHVARPIDRLAGHIGTIAENDFHMSQDVRADLGRIAATAPEEVRRVADAFTRMEARLGEHIVALQKATAERERIESDLRAAREIQTALLRKVLPRTAEVESAATLIPAKEVGGDFYDAVFVDEHRVLVTVADVSGKGVPAGLFMAVTKTLLDLGRASYSTPQEILEFINDRLAAENDACMFVTTFLGLLDVRTGEFHYSNGGHNPPYVVRTGGGLDMLRGNHGMALGIAGGMPFASARTVLAPGDMLFLYTDGVTEALDRQDKLFSEARLEVCLREVGAAPSADATASVIRKVREFADGAPQADDITVLSLRLVQTTPPLAA